MSCAVCASAVRKLFSNKTPLCYAMLALAYWASYAGKEAVVMHIPGEGKSALSSRTQLTVQHIASLFCYRNELADHISRWRKHPRTIDILPVAGEEHMSVSELFRYVWGGRP